MNKDKNGQICVNKGTLFVLLAVLVVGFAVIVSRTDLLSSFSQAAPKKTLVGVGDTACDNNNISGYYKSTYNANAINGSKEYCFKYTIVAAAGANPKYCSRGAPVKMSFCTATAVTQLSQADIIAKNSSCASLKGQVGRTATDSRSRTYCQKFNGYTYSAVDLTDGKRKTAVNPQVTPTADANSAYCSLDNKLYWDTQCSLASASTTVPFANRPAVAAKCQLYKGVVGRTDARNVAQQFSGDVNYLAVNPNVTEWYGDTELKYCKLDTTNLSYTGAVTGLYYAQKDSATGKISCAGLSNKKFLNISACQSYVSRNWATLSPNSTKCYADAAACTTDNPAAGAAPAGAAIDCPNPLPANADTCGQYNGCNGAKSDGTAANKCIVLDYSGNNCSAGTVLLDVSRTAGGTTFTIADYTNAYGCTP